MSETSPLLRASDEPERRQKPITLNTRRVLTLCFGLCLVADLGGSVSDIPEIRLLEMAVCRDFYRRNDPTVIGPPPLSYVDETLCKDDSIQSELAYLRASKDMLMMLPGLLVTLVFGKLADVYGRKPVIILGLTGQIMAYLWVLLVCYFHEVFPTKCVLLAAIFPLIGGGNRVVTASVNMIIVDTTPENYRTTAFYVLGAAVTTTDVLATPLGSWLLSKDLWLPFKFSTPFILSSLLLAAALPETLQKQVSNSNSNDAPNQMIPDHALSRKLQHFATVVFRNRSLLLCFGLIFLSRFSAQANSLFVQFASKRLDIPISQAGYITTVQVFVSLGVLIFLAGITRFAERANLGSPLKVDVTVARISLLLLIIGTTIKGFSSSVATLIIGGVVSATGMGVFIVMQGIIPSFASVSDYGQLYAGVAMIELVSGLSGKISFAAIFSACLKRHVKSLLGVPFLCSTAIYCGAFLLATFIPTQKESQDCVENEQNHDQDTEQDSL